MPTAERYNHECRPPKLSQGPDRRGHRRLWRHWKSHVPALSCRRRGGNIRVGLEDSLYIGKRQLATSNAQQVEKVRGIIESLGMTAATPDEARDRLALKGADRVEF